eukprot:GGOE01054411.1.p1 GENE.GGOE01054411.1~~GGOE01054411.1.p1  ORF type:complete len:257 (-),score=81.26 GGOE01054411.1:311-979(-)
MGASGWEDANLTIANMENENAILRGKNSELVSRINNQRGKQVGPQLVDPATVKQLERQCRDLEDYISELEERRGLVDAKTFEEEKLKNRDLVSRVGLLEQNSQRLLQENSALERESADMREQSATLRRQLQESKDLLSQSERMLASTKEKWEVAEADRDKLRRDLKDVEDREIKHLEVQKQLTHRAETAQKELDAVYKWYGERKCQCFKKKDAPEPWKKFMK